MEDKKELEEKISNVKAKIEELKSTTTTKTSYSGVSTYGLLGVAFVVLKLCNVINWSWWIVLLPFYLWIFALILLFICLGIMGYTAIKVGEAVDIAKTNDTVNVTSTSDKDFTITVDAPKDTVSVTGFTVEAKPKPKKKSNKKKKTNETANTTTEGDTSK